MATSQLQSLTPALEAAWDGIILAANPNWRLTSFSINGVNEGSAGIPEPATFGLLAGALAALCLLRRSQRAR